MIACSRSFFGHLKVTIHWKKSSKTYVQHVSAKNHCEIGCLPFSHTHYKSTCSHHKASYGSKLWVQASTGLEPHRLGRMGNSEIMLLGIRPMLQVLLGYQLVSWEELGREFSRVRGRSWPSFRSFSSQGNSLRRCVGCTAKAPPYHDVPPY